MEGRVVVGTAGNALGRGHATRVAGQVDFIKYFVI
jgi:hypothetical protein